ncbi:MAG: AbrB/MazE/SpoVT family DNA-binding domain-containing protein [Burkholderiales bacterium]|nr:AbrB/MazE/SpoVT family DNA-binding domain-containing protein [Burkholderiales bacterium]
MNATVTSKGQVTLPKAIRDRLGIRAGSRLKFEVTADGRLTVTPARRGADSLFGVLHRPRTKPATVKEMDGAIAAHVARDQARIARQQRGKR